MEEDDEIATWKEDTGAEDDHGWAWTDGLVEGVEGGRWQDETTNVWSVGKCKDRERDSSLLRTTGEEKSESFGCRLGVGAAIAE